MGDDQMRDDLAELLSVLLYDRGNRINEWPEDEAEAYREFGWAEGVANARRVMFEKAAAQLLAAGYTRNALEGSEPTA